jgi:hypothetical protein
MKFCGLTEVDGARGVKKNKPVTQKQVQYVLSQIWDIFWGL